ncbi:hypothetical protein [Streptomyces liangshanensis]|uniref:hypothetical protein n=1 Tax=Streptomyces liangshanensis TaxID=2717324 RepID=UPI0036DC5C3B
MLEAMRAVDKQQREDVGTESVLYALVSGDWAAGSVIVSGVRAAGSLAGSIRCRGTSVWVSSDTGAGDGVAGNPDDEREIDAFWREVRLEKAKRLRSTHRNEKGKAKEEPGPGSLGLPAMSGALRGCLRGALEAAREESAVSVRVRHVARALVGLSDSRAREALVLEKVDIPAAAAALDTLQDSDRGEWHCAAPCSPT